MERTGFVVRYGRMADLDRSFDRAFWAAQSPQARFDATWELIVHASRVRGSMFVNSDFSDLLRYFSGNSVRCLAAGGYAVVY